MKILASVLVASGVFGHDGDILDGDILLTKCDFRYLENRGTLPNYFFGIVILRFIMKLLFLGHEIQASFLKLIRNNCRREAFVPKRYINRMYQKGNGC